MRFYFSCYCTLKSKSTKKVLISDSEIYADDDSEQAEILPLIKKVEEFAKEKFLESNPTSKEFCYVEFSANISKGGKLKDVTGWKVKAYTREELTFIDLLIRETKRQELKYIEEEKLEKENKENGI